MERTCKYVVYFSLTVVLDLIIPITFLPQNGMLESNIELYNLYNHLADLSNSNQLERAPLIKIKVNHYHMQYNGNVILKLAGYSAFQNDASK